MVRTERASPPIPLDMLIVIKNQFHKIFQDNEISLPFRDIDFHMQTTARVLPYGKHFQCS